MARKKKSQTPTSPSLPQPESEILVGAAALNQNSRTLRASPSEKKIRVLLRIFESDLDRLQRFYPDTPYNQIIRILLRKHLDSLEKKIEAKSPTKDLPNDL